MSGEQKKIPNPAYRNMRAEHWREVARCLRLALGDAVAQLKANKIEPASTIKDALIRGHVGDTSYAVRGVKPHACDYDDGFCVVCAMPEP